MLTTLRNKQIVNQAVTKTCRIPPLQMDSLETMQTIRVFVSLKIRIDKHFMDDRKNERKSEQVHIPYAPTLLENAVYNEWQFQA